MAVMDPAADVIARSPPPNLFPSETERPSLTDPAMSDAPITSKARVPWSDRILGLCYWIHGVAVGGFCLTVVLVNSQGARSAAEAGAAIALALLQPAPMIVAGCALLLGWRRARLLAMLLPVIMTTLWCLGRLGCPPEWVRRAVPPFLPFYFCALQAKNIPGASVLAVVAAILIRRSGHWPAAFRKPMAFWAVVVLVFYPPSFGPACWMTSWCSLKAGWLFVVYAPMIWLMNNGPDVLSRVLSWYSLVGTTDGWVWAIDKAGRFVDFIPTR
jgi:hypothetical protein